MFYQSTNTMQVSLMFEYMKVTVAVLDKNGDSTVERVLDVLNSFDLWMPSHFGLISPKKCVFEKNVEIIKKQGLKSSTAAGYVTSKPKSISDYEHLQLDDEALLFEGRVYSPITETAVTQQVAKAPTSLRSQPADNDGASGWRLRILLVKNDWVAAGRDPIGVQPLYYGENRRSAAFATNKKALWKLGIENATIISAGKFGVCQQRRLQIQTYQNINLLRTQANNNG